MSSPGLVTESDDGSILAIEIGKINRNIARAYLIES
jgi:hypothetical protein